MAQTEPKPRSGGRRPSTRAVTRGGGDPDPQAVLRQGLEAAGVDVAALLNAVGGTPGVFSAAHNPQLSRQIAMTTGQLISLRPDLQQAIERDPEKAALAMRRVQSALLVLAEIMALYRIQGTVPAAEEPEIAPDGNPGEAAKAGAA